jgi:hypothetical protein
MAKPSTPADAKKIADIVDAIVTLATAIDADETARTSKRAVRDAANDEITALTQGLGVKRVDLAKLAADLKTALG